MVKSTLARHQRHPEPGW